MFKGPFIDILDQNSMFLFWTGYIDGLKPLYWHCSTFFSPVLLFDILCKYFLNWIN